MRLGNTSVCTKGLISLGIPKRRICSPHSVPNPVRGPVRRIRVARENFVALLDENSERGLLRLSHARELLEDDPRWRVREATTIND